MKLGLIYQILVVNHANIDLMVQNDTFRGIVSGTIRGARTVRINPNGGDTYEVVLEIDTETLEIVLNTQQLIRDLEELKNDD